MDNYNGMLNPVEICNAVGIDEDAFQVLFEYDNLQQGKMCTPYVMTHIAGGQPVPPEALYDENMLLYEVEMLFEAQMKELALELNAIRKYRATMYGPVKGDE